MPFKVDILDVNNLEARQQYGALCYRRSGKKKQDCEVLLITSRDTGRWVTPKGWPMANKAPHEVAEQEAYEEAGIKGTVSDRKLGSFSYLKRLNDGSEVPCVVDLYPLLVKKAKAKFPEVEERTRRWTSAEEAAELVDESGLKALLIGFAGAMTTRS
ncbi:NUDIX hydrolase [Martelella alba]|uniref:NUDIX hydrolase n=1 Tax=Martelella alba TaxID=2590451 RepID=A0A506U5Z6_9HYPH|nr:NUDIX hydrolase [Martelella alba]TPW28776.1 NUDIX hydrolase [Martelella alba]